jgi:hypothetical protein
MARSGDSEIGSVTSGGGDAAFHEVVDLLSEAGGPFRKLVETRARATSRPVQLPDCWYEAVHWLETYGYVPDDEGASTIVDFLRVLSREIERLDGFLQLSLACCLYFHERHERSRVLHSLPEPLRMPTLCRFEELRVHAVPARGVSQWAVDVFHLCADELYLGSRLAGFSFAVGAFARRYPRELRFVLQQAKVSESKVMSMTRVAPDGVAAWYERTIPLIFAGGDAGD